jgi:hypothetical protein
MAEDPKKLYDVAAGSEHTAGPVLHVRIQGRSRDIALDLLHIGPDSPDDQVRDAVARFMELPPGQLQHTVIERHQNGNITLRPEAVFG